MAKIFENSPDGITQEQIARCAYELWEQEGRPEGRSTEHWLQAEQRLRQRGSGQPQATAEANTATAKARRAAPPRSTTAKREKRFEMVS